MKILHRDGIIVAIGPMDFEPKDGEECIDIGDYDIPENVLYGYKFNAKEKKPVKLDIPMSPIEHSELIGCKEMADSIRTSEARSKIIEEIAQSGEDILTVLKEIKARK